MKKHELQGKRAAIFKEMKGLNDTAKAEKRNFTADESAKFDNLMAEHNSIVDQIKDIDTRDEETRGRVAFLESVEKEINAPGTPRTVTASEPNIGLTDKETRKYSLMKAIEACASKDWRNAGLELEVSEAIAKRSGRNPRGFYVPNEILTMQRDMRAAAEQRAMSIGTDSAGGYLKDTDLKSASFIDILMNKMVVKSLGATVLAGLVGDIDIPKKTARSTAYWVAEGGAPTGSQATLGQVAMSPNTIAAYTELTRKFRMQSSIDADNFVINDLSGSLALGIDYAALFGPGTSNQPTGVANQTGIGAVAIGTNGGPITWDAIVDLETEVAVDNADIGRLAYVTNTKVRGACKKIEKVSSTGIFIWEKGQVNEYPVAVSNQIPSTLDKGTSTGVCSAMLFGNWVDLLIGAWGGLDITVNPYALDTSGGLRITAFQDCDIQLRHAESFAACQDITTA